MTEQELRTEYKVVSKAQYYHDIFYSKIISEQERDNPNNPDPVSKIPIDVIEKEIQERIRFYGHDTSGEFAFVNGYKRDLQNLLREYNIFEEVPHDHTHPDWDSNKLEIQEALVRKKREHDNKAIGQYEAYSILTDIMTGKNTMLEDIIKSNVGLFKKNGYCIYAVDRLTDRPFRNCNDYERISIDKRDKIDFSHLNMKNMEEGLLSVAKLISDPGGVSYSHELNHFVEKVGRQPWHPGQDFFIEHSYITDADSLKTLMGSPEFPKELMRKIPWAFKSVTEDYARYMNETYLKEEQRLDHVEDDDISFGIRTEDMICEREEKDNSVNTVLSFRLHEVSDRLQYLMDRGLLGSHVSVIINEENPEKVTFDFQNYTRFSEGNSVKNKDLTNAFEKAFNWECVKHNPDMDFSLSDYIREVSEIKSVDDIPTAFGLMDEIKEEEERNIDR